MKPFHACDHMAILAHGGEVFQSALSAKVNSGIYDSDLAGNAPARQLAH